MSTYRIHEYGERWSKTEDDGGRITWHPRSTADVVRDRWELQILFFGGVINPWSKKKSDIRNITPSLVTLAIPRRPILGNPMVRVHRLAFNKFDLATSFLNHVRWGDVRPDEDRRGGS